VTASRRRSSCRTVVVRSAVRANIGSMGDNEDPLKAYEEFGAFKLYAHDVGLVAALASLPQQAKHLFPKCANV